MQPLVSCLMPTYNRREFIPRAIKNFQQQTYPNLELIVVDDGTDKIADLIPRDDPRIRYFYSDEEKETHGQKMNLALSFSEGDYAIVFDDDDYYSPDRVARQIEPLVGCDAIVSGTSHIFYVRGGETYLYRWKTEPPPWIGAIAFRRDYWEQNQFKDVSHGADLLFQKTVPQDKRVDLRDPSLLVATLHIEPARNCFTPIDRSLLPEYFRNAE